MKAATWTSLTLIALLSLALAACGGDATDPIKNDTGDLWPDTTGGDTAEVTTPDTAPEQSAPICTPGKVECKGEKGIQTCAADGRSWIASECYYKCVTEADGKALCKDRVCQKGSHRCAGSRNLLICKEDETGFDTFPCPEGALCDPNLKPEPECVEGPKCTPSEKTCDDTGKYLKVCVKSGTDYTFDWQKCPYGCDPTTLACKDAVCEADAHRCSPTDPDVIEECSKDQTSWKFVQKCLTGCKNGTCEDKPCTAGQKRCNYYAVEVCKPDGSGWQHLEGCQTSCVQEGNNAFCAGCVPGQDYCEDGNVMTCPDPSQPAQVKQACAVGQTCAKARCLDEVVLSDALGLNPSYLALAEAVTFCWSNHEGAEDNQLCAVVNASAWSEDVTFDSFITNWYCDDDIWYDYIYDSFADGDYDALWLAEGLFSCFKPENRVVDLKAPIPAGSNGAICIWYDTWVTDKIVIEDCDSFDTVF